MKRILFYILLLAFVLVVPVERVDIATLRPVQTVAVTFANKECCIVTDTGNLGVGENALSALEDLKRTTPGIIYLDTADYLLVSEGAQEQAQMLRSYMSDSVRVYQLLGTPDLEEVSAYLQIHDGGVRLSRWKPGMQLPVLDGREARLKLL